ncbi:MAG TPA: ABC-three component system protein [Gemmataceae bacterium]|nr:ABC-three component system protein [Gemmataceae bacterium]
MPELLTVLTSILAQPVLPETDIRPVPPEKLTANGLSESVRLLLALGMTASDRVKAFFARYYDPTLGGRVAQAFRRQYESLRAEGLSADGIFAELQAFAGGQPPSLPQRQAAVLTVLAYLFEACDIYERPREGEPP